MSTAGRISKRSSTDHRRSSDRLEFVPEREHCPRSGCRFYRGISHVAFRKPGRKRQFRLDRLPARQPALRRAGGQVTAAAYAGTSMVGGDNLNRAMVVAVIAMRMLEAAVDDVVDMVAMRHGFVSAAGTMHVTGLGGTSVLGRASVGVALADLYHMLIVAVPMRVLQMAFDQVVEMTVVADCRVAAARSMMVRVLCRHCLGPLLTSCAKFSCVRRQPSSPAICSSAGAEKAASGEPRQAREELQTHLEPRQGNESLNFDGLPVLGRRDAG